MSNVIIALIKKMKYHKAKIIDYMGFKWYIDEDIPKDTIIIYDKDTLEIKPDTIKIKKEEE